MEKELEWKELEKTIKEIMEPQKDGIRELLSELNGKVMDYSSCRVIEDVIEVQENMWLQVIKELAEKARKKIEDLEGGLV